MFNLGFNVVTVKPFTCAIILLLGLGWFFQILTNNCFGIWNKDNIGRILDNVELQNLAQEDHTLWKYVRKHHLIAPPSKPYNFVNATAGTKNHSCIGQCLIAMRLLKNMTNGFYVEAGSYDGERISNTLALERQFGWSGLLVEADPLIYPRLKSKRRKAWISDACLSPTTTPQLVPFKHAEGFDIASRVEIGNYTPTRPEYDKSAKSWTSFEVQCFPIYAILSAINVNTVDYFSLDVEGLELKVLQSIPFNKLFVKVFSVEYHMLTNQDQTAVLEFMKSKNYVLVQKYGIDFIFVHPSILDGKY